MVVLWLTVWADSEIPLMRSSSPALVVEEVEVDLVEPVRADRFVLHLPNWTGYGTRADSDCS